MKDIGERAGVSQATVSLVLNGIANARVAPATRKRVIQAAEALGYIKASRLGPSASDTGVVGLLIDEVSTTPFAMPFIEGARDAAALNRCIVAVFCTRSDPELEAAALDALARTNLVGVIYTTLITHLAHPPERLNAIPTVLLNCHDRKRAFSAVLPSDVHGAYAATEALLRAGHRRIAHLAGEGWLGATRDREQGYRQALTDWNVPVEPDLIMRGGWTVTGGRELAGQLFGRARPPTALFCFNDRMAIGAYDAARMHGLRIPEDVSIVGYDDEDLASYMVPPLSTVVLPHDEMARRAVATLIAERNGAATKTHHRVKIESPLVLRASIAPPRAGSNAPFDIGPSAVKA